MSGSVRAAFVHMLQGKVFCREGAAQTGTVRNAAVQDKARNACRVGDTVHMRYGICKITGMNPDKICGGCRG